MCRAKGPGQGQSLVTTLQWSNGIQAVFLEGSSISCTQHPSKDGVGSSSATTLFHFVCMGPRPGGAQSLLLPRLRVPYGLLKIETGSAVCKAPPYPLYSLRPHVFNFNDTNCYQLSGGPDYQQPKQSSLAFWLHWVDWEKRVAKKEKGTSMGEHKQTYLTSQPAWEKTEGELEIV